MLINAYRDPTKLFIDGDFILSQEGTTQGDPLAMTMYALGTLPLIQSLQEEEATQIWYADDASAGGQVAQLCKWWEKLTTAGPHFGYLPNPTKSWLVVKPQHLQTAKDLFWETGVNITVEGHRHLGAPIGSRDFVEDFVREKVHKWKAEIEKLSNISRSKPQAAYAVFTHGIQHRWSFMSRTIPDVEELLQPLEDALRYCFIPTITGRPTVNDTERELMALPAREGGLGISIPHKNAHRQAKSCLSITKPLVQLILDRKSTYPQSIQQEQKKTKSEVRTANRLQVKKEVVAVKMKLTKNQQRSMEHASERGASSWLTVIPMAKHGFNLQKQAFRDALALRYGWPPLNLPTHCACGQNFSVNHAFTCPKGALPSIRHNKIRDITANLLTEVCPNVGIEPTLQVLSGESFPLRSTNVNEGARLDIKASDFWDKSKRNTFFDVRVFNYHAPTNCKSSSISTYRKHEQEKRRSYERRIIEVEHGTFTPLVFSTSGGWGPAATVTYKRLASMIAEKYGQSYNSTLRFIRCKIAYSLLDSAVMCLRAPRSSMHSPTILNLYDQPLDLVNHEAQIHE